MALNRRRAWREVLETWLFSFVCLLALAAGYAVVCMIAARFKLLPFVLIATAFASISGLFFSIFSEKLLARTSGFTPATEQTHPRFYRAVNEVCSKLRMRPPRLYIMPIKQPNACAFGLRLFGRAGVAVSQPLLGILSDLALRGVIAHEIGHLRSFDSGAMSLLSLARGGAKLCSKLIWLRFLGRGKWRVFFPLIIFSGVLWLLGHVVLAIITSAFVHLRERRADLLSALYLDSTAPLGEGLSRIAEVVDTPTTESVSIVSDLFIGYPGMRKRIRLLSELEE